MNKKGLIIKIKLSSGSETLNMDSDGLGGCLSLHTHASKHFQSRKWGGRLSDHFMRVQKQVAVTQSLAGWPDVIFPF